MQESRRCCISPPAFLEGVGANHRIRSGRLAPSRKAGQRPLPLSAPQWLELFSMEIRRSDNVVATVYERGGYDVQIDYRKAPPPPPLTAKERRWAAGLLRPRR